MKRLSGLAVALLFLFFGSLSPGATISDESRHRLIVLTDIKADPDDEQSLIRLVLYANEIDIEGLIATTSTHKRSSPATDAIREILHAYGTVRDNLLLHDPGYPSEADLSRLVTEGSPTYGMTGVGPGKDSEGSDRIIRALEADDERPVWISVWGGVNTLAQALYRIREDHSAVSAAAMVAKLRVYTISDQDDSGAWIRREFPDLFYIVSPGSYGRSTWTAFTRDFPGFGDSIGNQWLADNIQQGHGPLGALYPDVAWGMEGDTPAYLALIPNGLSVPDRPDWGGWGGRYELYTPTDEEIGVGDEAPGNVPIEPETRPIWTNAVDRYTPWVRSDFGRSIGPIEESYESNQVTLLRWRDDIQSDFAARMDWTMQPYDEANHAPIVKLAHAAELTATSGQGIGLDASGTRDPDADSLTFHWFNYPEAGTLEEPVDMGWAVNQPGVWFTLPEVEVPETVHFILRVTDKGQPPLSRYARVRVSIVPK